ncbi:unnamed protein product [Durusdinium trenchii]|uniref:Uncharacterized protein n=1 Tax=Durusdinium trenchii TaxID=1381693 RepID=A0ABP0JK62_9DINO
MSMMTAARFGEILSQWPGKEMIPEFDAPKEYVGKSTVTVKIDGKDEVVQMDPDNGPMLWTPDGSRLYTYITYCDPCVMGAGCSRQDKSWSHMTFTEQTIQVHMVAKCNRRRKELYGVV